MGQGSEKWDTTQKANGLIPRQAIASSAICLRSALHHKLPCWGHTLPLNKYDYFILWIWRVSRGRWLLGGRKSSHSHFRHLEKWIISCLVRRHLETSLNMSSSWIWLPVKLRTSARTLRGCRSLTVLIYSPSQMRLSAGLVWHASAFTHARFQSSDSNKLKKKVIREIFTRRIHVRKTSSATDRWKISN